MKYVSFLLISVLFSCGGITEEVVQQMRVQVANNETQLDKFDSWQPVGQTVVLISTTDTCNISALFNAEASGANATLTFGSPLKTTYSFQVRILIDDVVASPESAVFINSDVIAFGGYSSHSFMATLNNVKPGAHAIRVEWKMKDPGISLLSNAHLGNRTLTVWTTHVQ